MTKKIQALASERAVSCVAHTCSPVALSQLATEKGCCIHRERGWTPAPLDLNFSNSVCVWGVFSVHRVCELTPYRIRKGSLQRHLSLVLAEREKFSKKQLSKHRHREPPAGRGARAQTAEQGWGSWPGGGHSLGLHWRPFFSPFHTRHFPPRHAHCDLWKISFDFFLFLPSI